MAKTTVLGGSTNAADSPADQREALMGWYWEVQCTTGGCPRAAQTHRVSLPHVALGVVALPQLVCDMCGQAVRRVGGWDAPAGESDAADEVPGDADDRGEPCPGGNSSTSSAPEPSSSGPSTAPLPSPAPTTANPSSETPTASTDAGTTAGGGRGTRARRSPK